MHCDSSFATSELFYFVSPYEVEAMLKALSNEMRTFLDSSDFSTCIDLKWVLLDDFNFPDVCWDTVLSRHSDEQFLLDFISDKFYLLKLLTHPHRHGNILDLIFCSTEDLWDVELKSHVLSDHYAIIFKSEVEFVSKNSGCCFSSTSFDPELLRKFLPLTRTFACRS